MTREEAIKYLAEELKKTEEVAALTERDFGVTESAWHTEVEAFNLAISALREQEEYEIQRHLKHFDIKAPRPATDTNVGHKWIGVEERLPEESVPVLIYEPEYARGYKSMATAFLLNMHWQGCVDGAVTHWMPLPEPPKEEV